MPTMKSCLASLTVSLVFLGTLSAEEGVEIATDVPVGLPRVKKVTAATSGPKHHFFGYYGICPWNADGSRLAYLETDVGDRLVAAGDTAAICLLDTATGQHHQVATTSAWNLQQGAMLHWLGTAPQRHLLYNDRVAGRLISV